jgi:type I restriction enzyme S subunit
MKLKTYKLSEICHIKGGKRLPEGHSLIDEPTEHVYIKARDIKGGKINQQGLQFLTKETHHFIKRYIVSTGDICITIVGANVGDVGVVPESLNGANLTENAVKLTSFSSDCDSHYLALLISQGSYKEIMDLLAAGAAQPKLGIYKVGGIKVHLPPLLIQRRIAAVLGRYDALLDNYQQQVAALEGLAQEVYREWFVRGRCPGAEAGTEGELPAGWRAGKLRDIVAFYIGGGWGQEEPDDEHNIGGHVVRGTDIPNLKKGTVNLDVYRYHKSSNMNSRALQAGDIVFEVSGGSKDQGLGRNVLLTEQLLTQFGDKVMAASFCKLIRPDQEITSAYYLQLLLDYLLENQEMAQYEVQSTGISNFQFEDFLDFQKVILPAKEALDRFDKIVAPIYQKLAVLSTQAAVLRATRDALLPRLLSGQLTVHEAEATLVA